MMSEGIQRAAGTQIRQVLRSITSNSVIGTLVGFITTSLVQSSSAITVLIVSFVNAGLINLRQSVGLIMGANIGTTITAWLIAFLGYNLSINTFGLPLFALGIPLMFRNKHAKHWGEFIIGLGLLIISLSFLKNAVPDINEDSGQISEVINNLGQSGIFSSILFIFIGMILTVITVSSSVSIAFILTLCVKGYVPFDLALFLVLGTNIGTCLTAELAAWVGNTEAKRAARIHTLFNFFGAIYMILLMPIFSSIIKSILHKFNLPDPIENIDSITYGLAMFHTMFNLFNTMVLLPLSGFLVKFARGSIKDNDSEKDIVKGVYISSSIKTPELSVLELRKNTSKYASILNRMGSFNKDLFNTFNSKEQDNIYKRIVKYSGISDNIYFELNNYLTRAFEEELSSRTNLVLRTLYNINRELNTLGMTYTDLANELERKRTKKIWVSPTQRQYINEFTAEITNLSNRVENLLSLDQVKSEEIAEIYHIYDGLATKKDAILDMHKSILETDYDNMKGAVVFENIIGLLFKACKHYKKIAFQISQIN